MDNFLFCDTDKIDGSAVLQDIFPKLTEGNVQFIKKLCQRDTFTYGELKIYEALLTARRGLAESILISGIDTDSLCLRETYADLLQKAGALYGKGGGRLTAHGAAAVCGEYMRYIGRYDGMTRLGADMQKSNTAALALKSEDMSLMFGVDKKSPKAPKMIKQALSVLLLDGEDYRNAAGSFIRDGELRELCHSIVKVGQFGIVGSLAELCQGVRADTRRLSPDLAVWEALTCKFTGRHLIICRREYIQKIVNGAEKHRLRALHFANTENSGSFTTHAFEMPMELIRALKDSQNVISISPRRPIFSEGYTKEQVAVTKNDGSTREFRESVICEAGKIIAPVSLRPDTNAFAQASLALCDCLLALVARGADRRSVASAVSYEFDGGAVSPEEMGENLGLILGVYRICVELAVSEGLTNVSYRKERGLLAALYATEPRKAIGSKLTSEGSDLALLSLGEGSEGLADFSELRTICDTFTDLCKSGRVLSAVAVSGNLEAAADAMGGELSAELSQVGEAFSAHPCRGILFETTCGEGLTVVGNAVKALQNTSDLAD